MPWGAVAGGVASAVVGSALSGGGGGGGGGGGQSYYVPKYLIDADTDWQNAFKNYQTLLGQGQSTALPAFQQAYQQQQGLNYQPYLNAANQAGQTYTGLGNTAMQQAGMYGQAAQTALGQQQAMYGAGQQILNTAFDPQNALYERTAQQYGDQVNAGQALRGLGTSAVGGQEYNQAMSNFNIDWQNQQLQRQAQGISSAVGANQAGVQQGNLMGQNLVGQLGAGEQGAGYYLQGAQTPLTAQQTVAGMPATNASQYLTNLGALEQGYSNLMGQAIPYMNYGQGAQQANYQNVSAQNAANAQLGTNLVSAVTDTPWYKGLFNSYPDYNPNKLTGNYNAYDSSSAGFVGPTF